MTAPTKSVTPKIEITIAIPLLIPFVSIHLQIGYRIKPMSNEKLNGINSVLPKYRIKEDNIINWSISKTENLLLD
jgi:hypothetical protein